MESQGIEAGGSLRRRGTHKQRDQEFLESPETRNEESSQSAYNVRDPSNSSPCSFHLLFSVSGL